MQPRWSPPIPQAMQRHGGPPKKAPVPETAKQSPQELDAIEPGQGMPERPQDRPFDRSLIRG
jgi:hypothetical protein